MSFIIFIVIIALVGKIRKTKEDTDADLLDKT